MEEKVIGVLGGMGPEATLDLYGKIIRNTPAAKDQDHMHVIIESNPKVPDRTAAVLGHGESPVPWLVAGVNALQRAGADFVVIPCVSAHIFLEEVQSQVTLPILSIFDAVAEAVVSEHPEIKTIGLLATTGTIKGGLFQKILEKSSVSSLTPEEPSQKMVMEAIYTVKATSDKTQRAAVTRDLVLAAESLIARGAAGIIAGCTEIPLALSQDDMRVPYFDAIQLLARASIHRAGRRAR